MDDLSRQHQTVFGDKKGNCFAACLACLLRLPVGDVPNFCGDNWEPNGEWFRECIRWLAPRGYTAICLKPEDWMNEHPGLTVIAGGPGPRGCDHCVLMRDGKLVHDPHPEGGGLMSVADVTLIVLLDGAVSVSGWEAKRP